MQLRTGQRVELLVNARRDRQQKQGGEKANLEPPKSDDKGNQE
jgi:hypothetical protein